MTDQQDMLDQLVSHRREQLRELEAESIEQSSGRRDFPDGSQRKWGLALSGGGIRSATFSFGVLRSLAANRLLLHFDLLSTVSGGGYIGGMLGRLFDRTNTPADAQNVQTAVARGESTWFGWWLRSNGNYLAPGGAKDRLFAIALYLRNLIGVHFEFALIGLLVGLALAAFDLLVWERLMVLGYRNPEVLDLVEVIQPWFATPWILVPLVLFFTANYGFAYWQLPWARSASLAKVIVQAAVTAAIPCATALVIWNFNGDVTPIGQPARNLVAIVAAGIGLLVFTSTWTARRATTTTSSKKTAQSAPTGSHIDEERNRLTRRLAASLRWLALVLVAGAIDRIAWWIAFESFATLDVGITLGVTVAVLRTVLSIGGAGQIPNSKTAAKLVEAVAKWTGIALTIILIIWWVAVVQKVVLGSIFIQLKTSTGPTPLVRELSFDNGWVFLGGLAIPIIIYALWTGRNLEFLNLSSLHAFYRARLVRAYLGAANGYRVDPCVNALDDIPPSAHTTTKIQNVGAVHADDDVLLSDYRPHKHGGPVHIINTCVNQTADPEGRLFNRDRKGLLLSVVGSGISQLSQEGWRRIPGIGKRSLGTWLAASGAAVAPGLGYRTQRGLSSLLTFAGVRLGFWLTRSARDETPGPLISVDKSKGLLAETLGSFNADRHSNWFITDGGHFENTGAYALLAAHCEFIVLVDCGADPNYEFGDIENLVRKARVDLGVEILFQKPLRAACEVWHGVLQYVGTLNELAASDRNACIALARVRYPGETHASGVLVIIKPNVCNALPMDINSYRQEYPDFPQQSTANQFFTEAQWESYFQLGKFLADKLAPDFIRAVLKRPEKYFEADTRAFTSSPAAEATQTAQKKPTRIPARIGVAAVGATLGAGAVATVGVTVWQAADSARASVFARQNGERNGMKELTDIWAKIPHTLDAVEMNQPGQHGQELQPMLPDAARDSVSTLAAALVRNADNLCGNGEARWLQESPLGLRIVGDTVKLCRLQGKDLSSACFVLLASNIGPVPAPYMSCLASPGKLQNARYWGYDYSSDGTWHNLHPCSTGRIRMLNQERVFLATAKQPSQATINESALRDIRDIGMGCHPLRDARPPIYADSQMGGSTPVSSASAPTQIPSIDSPATPPNVARERLRVNQHVEIRSTETAEKEDICRGKTVFIQVYDGADRDIARTFRAGWRSLGASVPPIEDVMDTARRSGRATPIPVRSSAIRYHDPGSEACAHRLAAGITKEYRGSSDQAWKVQPLAAGLQGTRGTIEVWVSPSDPLLKETKARRSNPAAPDATNSTPHPPPSSTR